MAIYLSLSRDHFAYGLKRKKTDKTLFLAWVARMNQKIIGSFSKDDSDGNRNGKKAIKQQLCSYMTFLCLFFFVFVFVFFLPSLHDYDMKMPNFTLCRGREHRRTTFFLFSWTSIQIQIQKNLRNKVWSRASSLFSDVFAGVTVRVD